MHNLLHLLCRLPNGANIHDCRPSEVGTGKTLHGRRHGGCEHDSLVEEMGGEGEGRRWKEKGREERGVVGEGGGGGKERGKGEEKGGEREGKRKGGKGEGRGERGKGREWDMGFECMYERGERKKQRLAFYK